MPVHIENYPRPQFVREAWHGLNGVWDFAFDDANEGETKHWYHEFPAGTQIHVPFTYETKASGIGDETFHPVVWYRRTLPPSPAGKRTILHFEGCDYIAKVWVNGQMTGTHRGGYARFSFDVTDLLDDGENVVVVRAEDFDDVQQPRGKQRWQKESFGCWYVQTTGIWKSVWLEYANEVRLDTVKMTPCLDPASLLVEWKTTAAETAAPLTLKATVTYDGILINEACVRVLAARGTFSLRLDRDDAVLWGVKMWSPEDPALYDVTFTLEEGDVAVDTVYSYFGLRDIRILNGQILLNGHAYYQRLILDQGYWADTHLTPPSEASLAADVDTIKALGFNGVRKHQKVEEEQFYYWCDVKGLLVWSEMPAPYAYGDDMADAFAKEWLEVVRMHYNHPSIVIWTPINESWGVPQVLTNRTQQHFTEAIYHLTKAFDPMRPVIVNDGWEHTVSDILTLHDYEESGAAFFVRYMQDKENILASKAAFNGGKTAVAEGFAYNGQPIIISEYGGAAYSENAKGAAWGYGNGVPDEDALIARIEDVTTAILKLPYVCGFCYTQITDVQQEVNGLLDAARNCKADASRLAAVFAKRV